MITSTLTRRLVVATAALALAAPAAAVAVPADGPIDTIVRNTADNPVPTQLVGTNEVTLAGTPTVAIDPNANTVRTTPVGEPWQVALKLVKSDTGPICVPIPTPDQNDRIQVDAVAGRVVGDFFVFVDTVGPLGTGIGGGDFPLPNVFGSPAGVHYVQNVASFQIGAGITGGSGSSTIWTGKICSTGSGTGSGEFTVTGTLYRR